MALIECHAPVSRQDVELQESHLQRHQHECSEVVKESDGLPCILFWVRCSILTKRNHLHLGQITVIF